MKLKKVIVIFLVYTFLFITSLVQATNIISKDEKIPSWIFPKPFKYKAKELPDPFIPFIKSKVPKTIVKTRKNIPRTPLQKLDPTQLKLVGIVYSKNKDIPPMALVELPNKKGYVLKIGTLVGPNGGYVFSINENSVIIREQYVDLFGKKRYNEIVLKLHKGQGENR